MRLVTTFKITFVLINACFLVCQQKFKLRKNMLHLYSSSKQENFREFSFSQEHANRD